MIAWLIYIAVMYLIIAVACAHLMATRKEEHAIIKGLAWPKHIMRISEKGY